MKKIIISLLTVALVSTGCGKDDYPFDSFGSGDDPFSQQPVSDLTDPALEWSADSFEATIGAENSFPTLSNKYNVGVIYESSHPEVATINDKGVITLVADGSTLISAYSAADETYSASNVSYVLTALAAESATGDDSLTFESTGDPSSEDDISATTFKGKITITFSDDKGASVKGDNYGYVTVDGNKVTVNNTNGEALIYELTGSTSNGFFKVYGAKKQAIVLNGVSITNPDGAALNNQNKKRTFIVVKGTNTLSDGASAAYTKVGEEDLKAVLFSEAQLIFSGNGLLTVNALNNKEKSAIASDDYIRLMNNPTIKVNAGAGAGHGVKGKDYVQLTNGALVVSTAGDMKKGISTDDYVLVEGGTHLVSVSGGVAWDEEDSEYSGSACIKADNYFAMTGGSLTIKNTGNGGKGINAGSYDFDSEKHTLSDSYITGGTLTVNITGKEEISTAAKIKNKKNITKPGKY